MRNMPSILDLVTSYHVIDYVKLNFPTQAFEIFPCHDIW